MDADDDVKDALYAELQAAVDNVPAGDSLVVAGDWNARTGPADETSRQVLGNFGLGTRCANGQLRYRQPIGGDEHLVTWYSNEQQT